MRALPYECSVSSPQQANSHWKPLHGECPKSLSGIFSKGFSMSLPCVQCLWLLQRCDWTGINPVAFPLARCRRDPEPYWECTTCSVRKYNSIVVLSWQLPSSGPKSLSVKEFRSVTSNGCLLFNIIWWKFFAST